SDIDHQIDEGEPVTCIAAWAPRPSSSAERLTAAIARARRPSHFGQRYAARRRFASSRSRAGWGGEKGRAGLFSQSLRLIMLIVATNPITAATAIAGGIVKSSSLPPPSGSMIDHTIAPAAYVPQPAAKAKSRQHNTRLGHLNDDGPP